MTIYAKRANFFDRGEQSWTVTPAALERTLASGVRDALPWAEVTRVRLGYEPTRTKHDRRVLALTARGRGTWTIDNMSFRGIADFEDRSASFDPFVLACVERLAAESPGAEARLGSGVASYWAQLIFVLAMFAALAAVIVLLPVEQYSGATWAKAAVIVASLPLLWRWIVGARPRRVALSVEAFREAMT